MRRVFERPSPIPASLQRVLLVLRPAEFVRGLCSFGYIPNRPRPNLILSLQKTVNDTLRSTSPTILKSRVPTTRQRIFFVLFIEFLNLRPRCNENLQMIISGKVDGI